MTEDPLDQTAGQLSEHELQLVLVGIDFALRSPSEARAELQRRMRGELFEVHKLMTQLQTAMVRFAVAENAEPEVVAVIEIDAAGREIRRKEIK